MKLVLLSGGSGKRLWPLSNDARSKQFLKVLENGIGETVSMVQRVWSQLENVGLSEQSLIATSKSQVEMIQAQLGNEVPIIVEPERRDTFPAIAIAAAYLISEQNTPLNETVVVLPVDPYVEDRFFNAVKRLDQVLQESEAELVLMGVRSTYPSAKYGYIVPERHEEAGDYFKVSHFREKPGEAQAEKLIEQGALWNCGVFAFKLGYLISLLHEKKLPARYDQLQRVYYQLPKISFDYEVVEKAVSIVAVPYDGYWKDLGTWNTLTEEMATSVTGRGIVESCENTHLINELEIPVVALGLSNIVVAASPDGILVTEKGASTRIKEAINFEQRPMYEERKWGWYKILDFTGLEDKLQVLTRRVHIKAGCHLSYQLHYGRNEVWTIIDGEGQFVYNHGVKWVKQGDVLQIPAKSLHGIKALTELELIEVQTGNDLNEDDLLEVYTDWEEVEVYCLKA